MKKPNEAFDSSFRAFANVMNNDVVQLLAPVEKIGGRVLQISTFVQRSVLFLLWLVRMIAEPDIDGMDEKLKLFNEFLKKAAEMINGNSSVFPDHSKAAALSLEALRCGEMMARNDKGMSSAVAHVEKCWRDAEPYCDKVLLKYRDKNPNHVEWAKALRKLYHDLRDYVESFYRSSPTWSSGSSQASSSKPKEGMSAGPSKLKRQMAFKDPLGPMWSSGSSQASSPKPKEGMSAGPSKLKRQMAFKGVDDQNGKHKGFNDYDSNQSVFPHGFNFSAMQIQDDYNTVTGNIDGKDKGKRVVEAYPLDPNTHKDDPGSGIVETDSKFEYEDPKKKVEAEFERRKKKSWSCDDVSLKAPSMSWGQRYRYEELHDATCGFEKRTVIGEGGFGIVHVGILPDASWVAVKKPRNEQWRRQAELDRDFEAEAEALGKVRHKNLLELLGYCTEGPQRMLVYKYVDNGNLERWLHGDVGGVSPLTWDIRMKIAFGTATGLAYMHTGLEPKIGHRDIKPSNILLDKDWNAIVSDLGSTKLLHSEQSCVFTQPVGTLGYRAPEYAMAGQFSEKSDVFSWGIVFIELLTNKRPTEKFPQMTLAHWFKHMVDNNRGEELIDHSIKVRPPENSLERALKLGVECTNDEVNQRPTMDEVAHKLKKLLPRGR